MAKRGAVPPAGAKPRNVSNQPETASNAESRQGVGAQDAGGPQVGPPPLSPARGLHRRHPDSRNAYALQVAVSMGGGHSAAAHNTSVMRPTCSSHFSAVGYVQ